MDFLSLEMLGRGLSIPSTLALGYVLSRRLLENARPIETVVVALTLACLEGLLALDLWLRCGLRLDRSLALVGPSCLVVLLLLLAWFRHRSPAPAWLPESRAGAVAMAGLAITVALLTNSAQLSQIDDDYWLHAPLQAHMLRGEFPPRNPYFSSLPLEGHYGRDLLIVAVARVLGMDLITAQAVTTTGCQVLSFLLLAILLSRFGPGPPAAVLGVVSVGLGVNMGYMSGLLQFYRNNSTVVSLAMLAAFYLLLALWQNPNLARTGLLVTVLGTLAFIYETHFGLVLLGAATVAGLRLVWNPRGSREALATAAAILCGLMLACLTGGTFTSMLQARSENHELPLALQNQGQRASLSFPKSPFFGLQVAPGDGLVSSSYQHAPLSELFVAFDGPGARFDNLYVPLWSWTVVRMHGLPLLLLPLSFLVLWRQRDSLGMLFLAFGTWAYLVPGMVNFGPIHEFEYFRWEFAASLGFCGGLSVALSYLWKGGGRVTSALIGALVCLNIIPGLAFGLRFAARTLHEGCWRTLTLQAMPTDWLHRQAESLRLREGDVEALEWLSGQARPGETVLVNFQESDPWEILFESTLGNLTGLYSVGHQLPGPEDMVGLPPFRMAPSYRDFLDKPGQAGLASLGVSWVYLRLSPSETGRLEAFDRVEGLRKVYEVRTGSNLIAIYRISL